MHYVDDLDLAAFVADGLEQLEAFLLKHALFTIYCELRDAQG